MRRFGAHEIFNIIKKCTALLPKIFVEKVINIFYFVNRKFKKLHSFKHRHLL